MVRTSEGVDDIGGLEALKRWLGKKKAVINNLPKPGSAAWSPKGVVIVGMPGLRQVARREGDGGVVRAPASATGRRRGDGQVRRRERSEHAPRAEAGRGGQSVCIVGRRVGEGIRGGR